MTGTSAPERGSRRDAQRNRALLIAAARESFAEHGVDARLDEIARRAGVGTGTLYRHFPTREALVEAIFAERVGEFLALAEAGLAEPDAWAGLVGFLEATLELQRSDRVLKEIFLRYPPGEGRLAETRAQMRAQFEELIGRARDQRLCGQTYRRRPGPAAVVIRSGDRRHRRTAPRSGGVTCTGCWTACARAATPPQRSRRWTTTSSASRCVACAHNGSGGDSDRSGCSLRPAARAPDPRR
jgi:AcrR family transcriptional regulator